MHRHRGFTLIEVLVTVGVIMLLSTVVYASLGPARESARQRVCLTNLRQIGQALQMYISDSDGVEPVLGQRLTWTEAGLPPRGAMRLFETTYIRNQGILKCPSYHDRFPVHSLGTTYAWAYPDLAHIPPDYRFSRIVERRGPDTPMLTCDEHNTLNESTAPRWETMVVHVLRLGGQVQRRRVPVRTRYHEW